MKRFVKLILKSLAYVNADIGHLIKVSVGQIVYTAFNRDVKR